MAREEGGGSGACTGRLGWQARRGGAGREAHRAVFFFAESPQNDIVLVGLGIFFFLFSGPHCCATVCGPLESGRDPLGWQGSVGLAALDFLLFFLQLCINMWN